MDIKDLEKKNSKDLEKLLEKTKEDLRSARFSLADKQLKDTSKIEKTRRDIARINMILRRKR